MLKKLFFVVMLLMLAFDFSANAQEVKGDPWIKQVYLQVYLRPPSAWEYNINNYNLGSWSSYGDLVYYVAQYQNSLNKDGYLVKTTSLGNNKSKAILTQNGKELAAALISNIGGELVGNDGTSLIGNDGSTLSVLSFADKATKFTQAGIKTVKLSGRSMLVIKK